MEGVTKALDKAMSSMDLQKVSGAFVNLEPIVIQKMFCIISLEHLQDQHF